MNVVAAIEGSAPNACQIGPAPFSTAVVRYGMDAMIPATGTNKSEFVKVFESSGC
jgi:hypothetical protein